MRVEYITVLEYLLLIIRSEAAAAAAGTRCDLCKRLSANEGKVRGKIGLSNFIVYILQGIEGISTRTRTRRATHSLTTTTTTTWNTRQRVLYSRAAQRCREQNEFANTESFASLRRTRFRAASPSKWWGENPPRRPARKCTARRRRSRAAAGTARWLAAASRTSPRGRSSCARSTRAAAGTSEWQLRSGSSALGHTSHTHSQHTRTLLYSRSQSPQIHLSAWGSNTAAGRGAIASAEEGKGAVGCGAHPIDHKAEARRVGNRRRLLHLRPARRLHNMGQSGAAVGQLNLGEHLDESVLIRTARVRQVQLELRIHAERICRGTARGKLRTELLGMYDYVRNFKSSSHQIREHSAIL